MDDDFKGLPDLRADHPHTVWGQTEYRSLYRFKHPEVFAFPRIKTPIARKIDAALETDDPVKTLRKTLFRNARTQRAGKAAIALIADYINPGASPHKYRRGVTALNAVSIDPQTAVTLACYAQRALCATVMRTGNFYEAPIDTLANDLQSGHVAIPVKREILGLLPRYRALAINQVRTGISFDYERAYDRLCDVAFTFLDRETARVTAKDEAAVLDILSPNEREPLGLRDRVQRFPRLQKMLNDDLLWSGKSRARALQLANTSYKDPQCGDHFLLVTHFLNSVDPHMAVPVLNGLESHTYNPTFLPQVLGQLGRAFAYARQFDDRKVIKAANHLALQATDPEQAIAFCEEDKGQHRPALCAAFVTASQDIQIPAPYRNLCASIPVVLDAKAQALSMHAALRSAKPER